MILYNNILLTRSLFMSFFVSAEGRREGFSGNSLVGIVSRSVTEVELFVGL